MKVTYYGIRKKGTNEWLSDTLNGFVPPPHGAALFNKGEYADDQRYDCCVEDGTEVEPVTVEFPEPEGE